MPVRRPELRAQLLDTLERCLADTENAWELDADGAWTHRRVPPGEAAARRAGRADARAPRARPARRRVSTSRAVIDLGSNSFRLVVFTTGEGGWWRAHRRAERHGADRRRPDARRRACRRRAWRTRWRRCACSPRSARRAGSRSSEVEAVATSAIRDAPNGDGVRGAARSARPGCRSACCRGERGGAVLLRRRRQLDVAARTAIVLDLGGGLAGAGAGARAARRRDRVVAAGRGARDGALAAERRPGRGQADREAARAHAESAGADAPWVASAGRPARGSSGSAAACATSRRRPCARGRAAARQRAGVRADAGRAGRAGRGAGAAARRRSASACPGSSAGAAR